MSWHCPSYDSTTETEEQNVQKQIDFKGYLNWLSKDFLGEG